MFLISVIEFRVDFTPTIPKLFAMLNRVAIALMKLLPSALWA